MGLSWLLVLEVALLAVEVAPLVVKVTLLGARLGRPAGVARALLGVEVAPSAYHLPLILPVVPFLC